MWEWLRRSRGFGAVAGTAGVFLVATAMVGLALGDREQVPPDPPVVTTSRETSTSVTTTSTTTTTTTIPPETLAEFVQLFAAALAADDVGFVFARLHPSVVDGYGHELCLSFVEREIVVLEAYRLVGEPSRLARASFELPSGTVTIDNVVSATVAFVFQGEEFEVPASFAMVDSEYRWMTQCR